MKKKKGAITVEFLAVLPVIFLTLWCITQMFLYLLAYSTAHEAAQEGAQMLKLETRGQEGPLPNDSTIMDKFKTKIEEIMQFNNFVLLFNKNDGTAVTQDYNNAAVKGSGAPNFDDLNIVFENYGFGSLTSEQACQQAMNNYNRVVCAYVKNITDPTWTNTTLKDQERIYVRIKAPFMVVGNFIPDFQNSARVWGNGTAQKELSDRFQYYAPSQQPH